jgi:hypothetical protein
MMDTSISPVTPEIMRQRGADAFDNGHGIDDHNMNPWSPAVADWRKGWQQRQAEVGALRVLAAAMSMGAPT